MLHLVWWYMIPYFASFSAKISNISVFHSPAPARCQKYSSSCQRPKEKKKLLHLLSFYLDLSRKELRSRFKQWLFYDRNRNSRHAKGCWNSNLSNAIQTASFVVSGVSEQYVTVVNKSNYTLRGQQKSKLHLWTMAMFFFSSFILLFRVMVRRATTTQDNGASSPKSPGAAENPFDIKASFFCEGH